MRVISMGLTALLIGMKRLLTLLIIVAFFATGHASMPLSHGEEPIFRVAEAPAKPWTFWYWMYGCVSKAGIHADLQGMKDIGLGGCYLMPIRGTDERPEYQGQAQQLSDYYWQMIDYAFQQADSLQLDLGIHICDGFALAGGPWISEAESMQQVVSTSDVVEITGNDGFVPSSALQTVPKGFTDIACYAFPLSYEEIAEEPTITLSPQVTRNQKGTFTATEAGWILYSYSHPVTVRNVEITNAGTNIQGERLLVECSDDGQQFRAVKQLTQPRQGWQSYLFRTINYSLPETTARYFRFSWTPEGTEPGTEELDAAKWKPNLKLSSLRLSSVPRIEQYLIKSGALWGIASQPVAGDALTMTKNYYQTDEMVHFEWSEGRPSVKLPKGRWLILRMGHAPTGMTNATAGGGKGLECDKFSPAAVNKQINNWFAKHKQRPHGNVVKCLHVDSWECGSQNWGYRFAEEFQARRGYNLLAWLPVMAGIPMESPKKSEQVLRDIRLTINDLINEKFFKTVSQRAHDFGVQFSSESVAPTMVCDGMEHFKYVDLPMGEFWLNSPTHDKPNDMLDAIHGAYAFGKNIVQAEGPTEVRGTWDETPALVKPLIDRNFALGMNRLVFHVNTLNPWLEKQPGMTLEGIGLFFQRDNTWYQQACGLVDYITRCQRLLQEGKPVYDLQCYVGNEMPRRALTWDKVFALHPNWVRPSDLAHEQARRANIGQPLETSPVGVTHAKNLLRADEYTNPLDGLRYVSTLNPLENSTERPAQDVVLPDEIDYIHRSGNREIYFLTNQSDNEKQFTASFRIQGKQAMIYDAVANRYYSAGVVPDGDRTKIALTLPKHGSLFVIFSDEMPTDIEPMRPKTPISSVSSPWTVTFQKTGIKVETDSLFDWSKRESPQIKYYAGTAIYETAFRYKGKSTRVSLNLGRVCDVATVYLNDVFCGIAWTDPYQVDISHALKRGKNSLRIELVNTWANALLGSDLGTPPFEGIWTNAKYRRAQKSPIPSGLLGPLQLLEERE